MSDVLYSKKQIDDAVTRSQLIAKDRPKKKVSEEAGDLELKREIPMELYLNAVQGHGVDPCDSDYFKSMEKEVPSIKVNATSGKLFFGSTRRMRDNYDGIKWSN